MGVYTDSSSKILLFTKNGFVYSIKSRMLQNIGSKGIAVEDIFDGVHRSGILNMFSIKEFDNRYIYFFSKYGMVKKTLLSDFEGNYVSNTAYKFKKANDELIKVEISEDSNEKIILITKEAMCIEFESESVSLMGRIASGVTGINLNEDDEVNFALLLKESNSNKNLTIKLKKGQKIAINIDGIKIQNRAGKGKKLVEKYK
jgi:topoisomerase-4 subunit A